MVTHLTGDREESLSRDLVFDVLSNRRRRWVLHYLFVGQHSATLDELSCQLAAWENTESLVEVSSRERKRVYTALRQTHLPKLARAGVIDYDDARGTIELTAAAYDLRCYLEVVPSNGVSWSTFYLLYGAVGTVVITLTALTVWPFTLLSGLAWAALIVSGLLVAASYQSYRASRKRLDTRWRPVDVGEDGMPIPAVSG